MKNVFGNEVPTAECAHERWYEWQIEAAGGLTAAMVGGKPVTQRRRCAKCGWTERCNIPTIGSPIEITTSDGRKVAEVHVA